jgi:3-hydroxyacyl-[acyl-carrier-protein] dehydratase
VTATLPATDGPPSPLGGPLVATVDAAGELVGTYEVTADEAVLNGHYPGFPIFPGVALLECVHRLVREHADRSGEPVELSAVESCRFLAAAFPGDVVTIRATLTGGDGESRCRATLTCGGHRLATARLLFRRIVT